MKKGRQSRLRLREIASAAGVSLTTVSRVLNGNTRVDPATRNTVLEVATSLNVDLDSRNKTKALAFLLCNRTMMHSFHSRILIGAEEYCASQGWDIIFLSLRYSPHISWKELHLPNVIQRHDIVRAVILAGTTSTNLLQLLHHKGINTVVLGNNVIGGLGDLGIDSVSSDDIDGSYETCRYMIGLGHREIWFVGNLGLPWFARCFEGYSRAMKEAGFELHVSTISAEDASEVGYLAAKSILGRSERVTAILAGNDQTAHGVYKALRAVGLRIPDDVSVAGSNDTIGAWLYPALTTASEFPEQLGRQMVEMALQRIAHPNLPPQSVTIPTELIVRDSCRQPTLAEASFRTHQVATLK